MMFFVIRDLSGFAPYRSRFRSFQPAFDCFFLPTPQKKNPHISLIYKDFCFLMQSVSRSPGAENETRTRDPDLGKVVLYQLSYFRNMFKILLLLATLVGFLTNRPLYSSASERKTRFELATLSLEG